MGSDCKETGCKKCGDVTNRIFKCEYIQLANFLKKIIRKFNREKLIKEEVLLFDYIDNLMQSTPTASQKILQKIVTMMNAIPLHIEEGAWGFAYYFFHGKTKGELYLTLQALLENSGFLQDKKLPINKKQLASNELHISEKLLNYKKKPTSTLDLSGQVYIEPNDLNELASLETENVNKLNLSQLNITTSIWKGICSQSIAPNRFPQLVSLNLSKLSLTLAHINNFIEQNIVDSLTKLTKLNLSFNEICDDGLISLLDSFTTIRDMKINLNNNIISFLDPEGLETLSEKKCLSKLHITLTGNYIYPNDKKKIRILKNFLLFFNYLLNECHLSITQIKNFTWQKIIAHEDGYFQLELLEENENKVKKTLEKKEIKISPEIKGIIDALHADCGLAETAAPYDMIHESLKKAAKAKPELFRKENLSEKNKKYLLSYRKLYSPICTDLLFGKSIFSTKNRAKVKSRWHDTTITKNNWIAYLIAHENQEHALIAIEGLEKHGQRVHIIADLTYNKMHKTSETDNGIKINIKTFSETMKAKYQTNYHKANFQVSASAAKKLCENLREEASKGIDSEYSLPFGGSQNESKNINCLGWAKRKFKHYLQIDIESQLSYSTPPFPRATVKKLTKQ